MIAVIGAISLVSMLAAATLAATNGDLNLVQRDLDYKRAHAAAQAGLADYSFHLNNDNSYWARCTERAGTERGQPGGLDGEPTHRAGRRPARATRSNCCRPPARQNCDTDQPGRIDARAERHQHRLLPHPLDRLRGRGEGVDRRHLQAGQPARLHLLHPVRDLGPGHLLDADDDRGAYAQCAKFRREGRESAAHPEHRRQSCIEIVFVSGDDINGPAAHQRRPAICGTPTFGRTAADVIEVSAPPQGWSRRMLGCSGDSPELHRPVRDHRAGADTAGDQRQAEEHRRAELHLLLPDEDRRSTAQR